MLMYTNQTILTSNTMIETISENNCPGLTLFVINNDIKKRAIPMFFSLKKRQRDLMSRLKDSEQPREGSECATRLPQSARDHRSAETAARICPCGEVAGISSRSGSKRMSQPREVTQPSRPIPAHPVAIYPPRGQAGEYAPLACNPYRGCGHGCVYCY